jgi:phosphate transport system substrate-binding protein
VKERGVDRKRLVVGALVLTLLGSALALTGCGSSSDGAGTATGSAGQSSDLEGSITIQGSDTMLNVGTAWSEAFMDENPGVDISVQGGGSGTGIASLINGTIDAANASREMKAEEIADAEKNGVSPVEHKVAIDGIAVVVNPANGVESITLDQLGKVFRGEITNWKDLGGADQEIVLL